MAQIRISFTSALVAMSLAICLVVGLAFVDRSRREDAETPPASPQAHTANAPSREQAFVQSAALSEPVERASMHTQGAGQAPPQFAWTGEAKSSASATQDEGADLPLDPRLSAAVAPPAQGASNQPPLTPAQLAGLSPEALAKRYQGKAAVQPGGSTAPGGAPVIAVPEGMYYARATPIPTPTPRPTPSYSNLPIMTNSSGIDGAMKGMGGSSMAGISTAPGDPALPFSHTGTVSTDRLRAILAGDPGLDPASLQGIDDSGAAASAYLATNAGATGWDPTQQQTASLGGRPSAAIPTPNPALMIKGGRPQGPASAAPSLSGTAGATGAPMLSPMPDDSASMLESVLASGVASPSPTPNFPGSTGLPAPASPGNKWNLPPPPSLKGPAIQPGAALAPSKLTEAPPLAAEPAQAAKGNVAAGELPTELLAKSSAGDRVTAARVDERTLSAREATQRAEAIAQLEGRKLDDDNRRMLSRTASEAWVNMVALAEAARKEGITVSPAEFAELLDKRSDLDQAKLEQALRSAGLTPSEVEAELRDICLGEKLVDATLTKNYSEQKLQSIYDAKPMEFQAPRRLHVQEIWKARPADAAAAKQVERDMDKLHQQGSSGADFGLLASQASEAPTRTNGGDLGWLDDRSAITEAMAKALLPLKPGQVSEIVSDPTGYHIYKLVDLQEPKPGFDGARDRVLASLRDDVRGGLADAAADKAEVEISHKTKKSKVASTSSKANRDAEIAKVLNGSGNRSKRSTASPAKPKVGNPAAEEPAPMVAHALVSPPEEPASNSSLPPGFGSPAGSDSAPTPSARSSQASGPQGAVQGFISRFRRPSPTIQQ